MKITDFSTGTGTSTVVVLPRAVAPVRSAVASTAQAASPAAPAPSIVAPTVLVQVVRRPDREEWELTGEQVAAQTRQADAELVKVLWDRLAQTDPALFAALWRKANSHGDLDLADVAAESLRMAEAERI